jgi:hypothetical protein
MAARCSGPRCSVRRVPVAVHVPSNACHAPARGVDVAGPPDWPHAAMSRRAASTSPRRPGNRNGRGRAITSLPSRTGPQVPGDTRRMAPWPGPVPRAKPRRKKWSSFSQRHATAPVRLAIRMTIPCLKQCNPSCNLTHAVAVLFTLYWAVSQVLKERGKASKRELPCVL